jgi:membrane-bound metal-dependent hydrolase YbcI (DUF457 family)
VITRHHISLAIGSIIILYFPLIAIHPSVLIALGAGVCAGVVVPDIQMKKPRQIRAIYFAWAIIQIFKRTILSLYVFLYRNILGIYPMSDDKRLTHSLPGLFFIAGLIGIVIVFLARVFPSSYPVHALKIFLAGIVMGLILHFLEDICTKKGLCLFYPFSESYWIAGSIRPCNKSDNRIRLFHIQMGIVIIGILLFYYTGFCPGYLKWPMSIATLCVCIVMMLYHAEVRIDSENSVDSIKFYDGTGQSM